MRILITGATGLIGQELGLELFKRGHEIFVVSRDPGRAKLILPFPCTILKSDLSKILNFPEIEKIEAVIHLMGENLAGARWSTRQKAKIFDSRILSTRNLVNSFKNSKPQVFVSTSAVGIYGNAGEAECDETSAPGNGFLAALCDGWEKEADEIQSNQTRVVKCRLAAVLSRKGGALKKMLPAFQAGVGGRLGTGQQWMSWIHIQDAVSLFVKAIEDEKMRGVYNFSSPQPERNKNFSKILAKQLRKSLGPPVPSFSLKILFGEMANVILDSQNVIPRRLLETGFRFQFPNLDEALGDLLQYHAQGEEVLETQQYLPFPVDKVFNFFSDAHNLETITPQNLKFHIVRMSSEKIAEGTEINYRLKIQGIGVGWKTLIREWNPPNSFIDQAIQGPYKFWHHTHSFEKLGEGTLMRDRVRYILPLGWLGWIVAHGKVRGDVEKIFDFRRKTVAQLLSVR